VKPSGCGTALDGLRQSGSLKAMFPRGTGAEVQAILVNTAGGITGGDEFAISARAAEGCRLTISTQAAERAYRAQVGEIGRLHSHLAVAARARLNWLPQETILFDGCALERSLTADLDEGAAMLLVEPLVFGRAAMGEVLRSGLFRDRIEIRRAGALVHLDAVTLRGDIAGHLARPHVAAGMGAMATLVLAAPGAASALQSLHAMLPATAGASLVRDDLLLSRILAPDSHELRRTLVPVLNHLTDNTLPRAWTI
jgi:urease accessory protein